MIGLGSGCMSLCSNGLLGVGGGNKRTLNFALREIMMLWQELQEVLVYLCCSQR
jgi:hypothetical protein